MCLVIAIILAVVGVYAWLAGEMWTAVGSGAGALFFIALMVRNIRAAMKRKREGEE